MREEERGAEGVERRALTAEAREDDEGDVLGEEEEEREGIGAEIEAGDDARLPAACECEGFGKGPSGMMHECAFDEAALLALSLEAGAVLHVFEGREVAAIEAFGRSLEDVPISVADLAASRRHAAEAESV